MCIYIYMHTMRPYPGPGPHTHHFLLDPPPSLFTLRPILVFTALTLLTAVFSGVVSNEWVVCFEEGSCGMGSLL